MFERIFSLIRKTGDRVIMVDPETDEAFVLLPLSTYEELIEGEECADSNCENCSCEHQEGENAALDEEWGSPWQQHESDYPLPGALDRREEEEDQKQASEAPDLTENQLIDKINHDIALWKAEQEAMAHSKEEEGGKEDAGALLDQITLSPVPEQESAGKEGEEKFYIEPVA